uniref:Uncharacterized protein n=1 Tax=Pyxicephalus adspersus TaxID=30357 RepID=A0AAV2ZVJ8_PYXAD|nr:TPA: hypothetical protein GDO54_004805 [Pyxicephalus adspersus]
MDRSMALGTTGLEDYFISIKDLLPLRTNMASPHMMDFNVIYRYRKLLSSSVYNLRAMESLNHLAILEGSHRWCWTNLDQLHHTQHQKGSSADVSG